MKEMSMYVSLQRFVMLALVCLGITSAAVTPFSYAHAEGLDRVYRVQATLYPTALVNGPAPASPTELPLMVGPNSRKGTTQVAVHQGVNGYNLDTYTLRVKLSSGSEGSFDNGTLNYAVMANVGHNTATHSSAMTPRVHGRIMMHDGIGQVNLPINKYFTGTLRIQAIATQL